MVGTDLGGKRSWIKTGKPFPKRGFYSYMGHVRDDGSKCTAPIQAKYAPFYKNEVAPTLITCNHDVYWKLLFAC